MDGDLGPSSLPLAAPVLQVSCLSTEVPHQETNHYQARGWSGGSGQREGEPLPARMLPHARRASRWTSWWAATGVPALAARQKSTQVCCSSGVLQGSRDGVCEAPPPPQPQ